MRYCVLSFLKAESIFSIQCFGEMKTFINLEYCRYGSAFLIFFIIKTMKTTTFCFCMSFSFYLLIFFYWIERFFFYRECAGFFMHDNYNKQQNQSHVSFANQETQNHIRKVFSHHVVIVHWLYHLNIELSLPLRKLWLEHNKKVLSTLLFESYLLSKSWHFSRCQVDSSFKLSSSIAEQEHVGIVFPPETLESPNDRNGIKGLPVEDRVLGKLVINLIESERDDSFIVDGFVVFFAGICHQPPDIIIDLSWLIREVPIFISWHKY